MAHVVGILVFVAVFAFLQGHGTAAPAHEKKSVFLAQDASDNKLVVIEKFLDEQGEGYKCRIIEDPAVVEKIRKSKSADEIKQLSVVEMEEVRRVCDPSLELKRRDVERKDVFLEGAPEEEEYRGWDMIFPGTKWCGAGDIAENDEDFGEHEDTDRCCQTHDKCDDIMLAGEVKNNLTNDSPFTSLSCKCDNDLYDCLKKVNTYTSSAVGYSYFTFLRRQCYKEDYPFSTKCKTYRTFLEITCYEYEKDTSKPKVYQWTDATYFK